MNWLELLYTISALLILLWLHSRRVTWGRVAFLFGLGFMVMAVWILEQLYVNIWLTDGLYFVLQAVLIIDYLLEKTSRWRMTVLMIALVGSILALFDHSGTLAILGMTMPEQSLVGWHSVFLLGVAAVITIFDVLLKSLGLTRIVSLMAILPLATLIWWIALARPYTLETQVLLLLVTFVALAVYLERSNSRLTMPESQVVAYQNLLGTLEQLANPSKTQQSAESDLVTTLFGTARVMASGSNDTELWEKLLGTAVLLVPGAEGGSLRLRSGTGFRYVAQIGYDSNLLELELDEKNAREWHGNGIAWHRGEPRIARMPEVLLGVSSQQQQQILANKRLRANLYLPVVVGNEVLADLNLDNFSNELAFNDDSIRAARQFSIQMGALMSAQRERRELEARLREFASLEAVAEALHDARTPSRIAESVLEQASRLLNVPHSVFLLISSDSQFLRVLSARGLFETFVGVAVPRGKGLSWAALEARGTIFSADVSRDPRSYDPTPEKILTTHCQLTVPILDSSGAPLGALLVARNLPEQFTNLDQRLTEVIAKVSGSALERIRATENLERQVFESRNLLNLARLLEGNDSQALENALERVRQLAVADAAILLRNENDVLSVQILVGKTPAENTIERSLKLEPLMVWARQPMQRSLELSAEVIGLSMRQIGVRSMLACLLDSGGTLLGTLVVYRFDQTGWNANEKALIAAAGGMIGALLSRLERLETLEAAYEGSLAMIGKSLEMRDLETGNHTERVTQMAVQMARALNLSEAEVRAIRWGAYLHDVGKFAISDSVLRKPGKLDPSERLLIQEHPQNGYDLIKDIPFLPLSTKHVVLYHHERWDGTGYPTRLASEDIPLAARIFAVCDVYDALQSKRTYKEAFTLERTLAELYSSAHSGHLELRLVRLLERILKENSAALSNSSASLSRPTGILEL
jgi:HD-GYP domain-containing protein (c-di-GMP phosphodiesterase class II)